MTYRTRDLLNCTRMSAALMFILMVVLLATGLVGNLPDAPFN